MTDDFNPLMDTMCETRWFDDYQVGERFYIPSRTMTDALFSAFQLASGDNHPIHYDRHYCREHGHRDLLAHGLQVLIHTAPGASTLPHEMGEALIGLVEQSSRILKPVYLGDTLYPGLEITELVPQNTTGVMTCTARVHNHDGELVLDGWHKLLIRRRGSAISSGA